MTKKLLSLFLFLATTAFAHAQVGKMLGYWYTIDD